MLDAALLIAVTLFVCLWLRERDRRQETWATLVGSDARNTRLADMVAGRLDRTAARVHDRPAPPVANPGPSTADLHNWGWMRRSTARTWMVSA